MTNDKTVTMSRELAASALNSFEYLALRGDDIGEANAREADKLRALLAQTEMWNPHPAEANLASLLIVLGCAGIQVNGGTRGDPWTVAAPVVDENAHLPHRVESLSDFLSRGADCAAPVVERQEPVEAILLSDCVEMRHNDYGAGYFSTEVTMLYTSPPAPVAVTGMRDFANSMIDIALEGGDADGAHIQELAVKHGLLKPDQRSERCGESCSCAEYADFPVECFRKVKELNQ